MTKENKKTGFPFDFFNPAVFVESVSKVHNLKKISNSDKLILLYLMVVVKTKERKVFKAIFKKSPYIHCPRAIL